jgi:hypothetical protein
MSDLNTIFENINREFKNFTNELSINVLREDWYRLKQENEELRKKIMEYEQEDYEHQMSLVEELREDTLSYRDASVFTVLMDLVNGNGEEEVRMILESVIDLIKKHEQ